MKLKLAFPLALVFIVSAASSQEPPTDFNFMGEPVAKLKRSIPGFLNPDAVRVVSILDAPLRPIDPTRWPREDDEISDDVLIYPVSHAQFLEHYDDARITGFSPSATAYRHWQIALQNQLSVSGAFSDSGGPNYAVYVIVTDIRIPEFGKCTSTVRVKATYRIVNLDSNDDLLELRTETLGSGEKFCWGFLDKMNASALNVTVRENIAEFFAKLQVTIDELP